MDNIKTAKDVIIARLKTHNIESVVFLLGDDGKGSFVLMATLDATLITSDILEDMRVLTDSAQNNITYIGGETIKYDDLKQILYGMKFEVEKCS